MILERVEEFIARSSERAQPGEHSDDPRGVRDENDGEFGGLALDVFAHQYEHVPLYRRLCELRGVAPGAVSHWSDIPAAPADLFKEPGLFPDAGGARTFLSSGTTEGAGRRSRHVVAPRELDLYRRSSLAHFAAMVLPDAPGPMAVVLLGPDATTHPTSSLGQMYRFVIDAFGAPEGSVAGLPQGAQGAQSAKALLEAEGAFDVARAVATLESAAAGTQPVLVLALSSTLTALVEELRRRGLALRLPADSRLVHTGGRKGGRTMSRGGLLKAAWRFLHIPAYLCLEEYGMTELLSQFYDDAYQSRWSGRLVARSKVGPRWTRTTVVDPATLRPVPRGERGILRHFDLANCGSLSAVQTLDLGVELGRGFEVLGRASGADVRGCSELMTRVTGTGLRDACEQGTEPDGE